MRPPIFAEAAPNGKGRPKPLLRILRPDRPGALIVVSNTALPQLNAPRPIPAAIRHEMLFFNGFRLMQALVSLDQQVKIVVQPARQAKAPGITVAA